MTKKLTPNEKLANKIAKALSCNANFWGEYILMSITKEHAAEIVLKILDKNDRKLIIDHNVYQ
jgi:hypothetical protein